MEIIYNKFKAEKMSELFDSCLKDFNQYMQMLQEQISNPDRHNFTSKYTLGLIHFSDNPYEFDEAQKLVSRGVTSHPLSYFIVFFIFLIRYF
jgi:hypothetical protein